MNQEASLTFCDPSNSNQKRVYSLKEKTLIGRQSDCDLVVDENQFPSVSRHHAEVTPTVEPNRTLWQITDLKAANGTFINGNRLQGSQNLKPGDRIIAPLRLITITLAVWGLG